MTETEFRKLCADFVTQATDIMLEKAHKYYAEHPEAKLKHKCEFKKLLSDVKN